MCDVHFRFALRGLFSLTSNLAQFLGVVPALAAVYFRATLPETPRYTMHVEGDVARAVKDVESVMAKAPNGPQAAGAAAAPAPNMNEGTPLIRTSTSTPGQEESSGPPSASWADFKAHFGQWRYGKVLLGCCLTWFLLDVAFYGLGLNQSIVLTRIGYAPASDASAFDRLWKLAAGNTVISLMGTVPGYWATVALVERLGRKKIQYLGFGVLTLVFVTLSAGYNPIKEEATWLFIGLYCIGLFMFNFGPNTTTFIIPGEVFPTRYRSTVRADLSSVHFRFFLLFLCSSRTCKLSFLTKPSHYRVTVLRQPRASSAPSLPAMVSLPSPSHAPTACRRFWASSPLSCSLASVPRG